MLKDERIEIQWASFSPGVRIHASAMETPAVAKSDSVRVYRAHVHGEQSLVVEDASLPRPVVVPWHNVGTVVYVHVEEPATPKAKPKVAEALL